MGIELLPSGLTQEEQDASDHEFESRSGLTTDDLIWFTYGERGVRDMNPNNAIVDRMINDNLAFRKNKFMQKAMVAQIRQFIDTDNLDELNLLIRMSHKILHEQITKRK